MPEFPPEVVRASWRVGRKVGRTIYAEIGGGNPLFDLLIGMMDTPELAAEAVRAHNLHAAAQASEQGTCPCCGRERDDG